MTTSQKQVEIDQRAIDEIQSHRRQLLALQGQIDAEKQFIKSLMFVMGWDVKTTNEKLGFDFALESKPAEAKP